MKVVNETEGISTPKDMETRKDKVKEESSCVINRECVHVCVSVRDNFCLSSCVFEVYSEQQRLVQGNCVYQLCFSRSKQRTVA